MRILALLFLLTAAAAWAADSTAPSAPAATTSSTAPKPAIPPQTGTPPVQKPAASVQKPGGGPVTPKPGAAQKPLLGKPRAVLPTGKNAVPVKPAQPVVVLPARFQQVRDEMNEIYPDANKLPVIWDEAHDPFRFGYSADDESTDATAGTAGATGEDKPAAPPKMDLDTASLLEAGLDMMGGKGPKKPAAGADAVPTRAFVPLTETELLKRAVGKLRIGGVVTVRGIPRIMIDGVPRKIGEIITVTVSNKQAKIQLVKIGDNTVEFVLQDTKSKVPSLEITF